MIINFYDENNNKLDNNNLKIKDKLIIEITNNSFSIKELIIFIDGFNVFSGINEDINTYKILKVRENFIYENTDFCKFTQGFSDFSFANDGDPKKRGVIGIMIDGIITELYYNNYNKKKLPRTFRNVNR